MTDNLDEARAAVRASSVADGSVVVFARKHRAVLGRGWSFDVEEPHLTGAEILLGALAADVLGPFRLLARQQRLVIDEVEASAEVILAHSLAQLGVIGATGEPHYRRINLRVFIGTSAAVDAVQAAWEEALRRAPLFQTLRHATALDITMQVAT